MLSRIRALFGCGELILSLTLFNLNAKYKGSFLGVLWSMLKPVCMMAVFSVVFQVIVRFDAGIPYPVFFLTGLLPWNFMSMSLSSGTNGLVDHANLIKKVAIPSETFILAIVLSNLVDLFLAFIVCFFFILIFQVKVSAMVVFLPLVILLHCLFIFGLSLLFSAANVFFRDVRQMVEVGLLAWFYVSPILYSVDMVKASKPGLVAFYLCNPMAVFIALYREVMVLGGMGVEGHDPISLSSYLLMALAWAVGAFLVGYAVFLRKEERFAELL